MICNNFNEYVRRDTRTQESQFKKVHPYNYSDRARLLLHYVTYVMEKYL